MTDTKMTFEQVNEYIVKNNININEIIMKDFLRKEKHNEAMHRYLTKKRQQMGDEEFKKQKAEYNKKLRASWKQTEADSVNYTRS